MQRILHRGPWLLNAAVISICACFAGRAAAHLVTAAWLVAPPPRSHPRPTPPAEPPRDKSGTVTLARNIFCSTCAPAPTTTPGPMQPDVGPRPTTLPLELVSTLIAPDPDVDERWSMAILRDLSTREKDPAMYNKGSHLAGAEIVKVLPRRVYLRNAGRLEYVDLEATPSPAATNPTHAATQKSPAPADPLLDTLDRDVRCQSGHCTLARTLVDKLLANTALLAASVRVMPLSQNGHGAGFRLDAIRPGSLFAHLGLQNGDTLAAVNGTELTTPDAALMLYTKLKTASHVSLQVERDGRRQTLDYTIE